MYALGVLCCFALFVCLTLLAFKNMYVCTNHCVVVSTSGVRGNKLDGKTRRDPHILCSTKLTTVCNLGNINYRHFLLPYKLFGCVYSQ